MGTRVRDVIHSLDYDELMKIKNDIDKGSVHFKKLVNEQIKAIELEHNTVCSTCMSEISPDSTSTFTLVFGPYDFKKKATFCAIDCLEYFINQMKEQKKGVEDAKERNTEQTI